MPVLYLTQQDLKATVSGERVEITPSADPEAPLPARRWVPLADIEHVVVDTRVRLSAASIARLLGHGIPVLFIAHGRFPGGWAAPFTRQHLCLADQLDASRDPDFRLDIARRLVDAKIRNMRRVLGRLGANRNEPAIAGRWLTSMSAQARAAASADALRGLEGAATGRYFEVLGSFFPREVPFERRTRRPPRNAANALLSFLYTLLIGEFSLHLRATGLETGWGFYHEPEDGRPALALDLVEPFRAPFADALAIDLLNHRRLKPEDFENDENGGVRLRRLARRPVFTWRRTGSTNSGGGSGPSPTRRRTAWSPTRCTAAKPGKYGRSAPWSATRRWSATCFDGAAHGPFHGIPGACGRETRSERTSVPTKPGTENRKPKTGNRKPGTEKPGTEN